MKHTAFSAFCLSFLICIFSNHAAFAMGSASMKTDPAVVSQVDLHQYAGLWYEVAHSPNFFQNSCVYSTAKYEVLDESSLSVYNICYKSNGKTSDISGVATIKDPAVPAKLKVRFSFFQRGDYWITELDDQYQWAVVSSPGKKFTFILAREPNISDDLKNHILEILRAKDFEVTAFIFDRSI
jgi:apolipoprotein D and lipocalin family protein